MTTDTMSLEKVVAFLLGEGSLECCNFGEKQPWHTGKFWWRTHLRNAIDAHLREGVKVPDVKVAGTMQDESYVDGWNACREAMLASAPQPDKESQP